MNQSEPTNPSSEFSARSHAALLAHIRHELRTPLNAIIGYSEMLLEDAEGLAEDHFSNDLQKIKDSGTRLLTLVNQLIDVDRIAASGRDLQSFGEETRRELREPLNAVIGYTEILLEETELRQQENLKPDLTHIYQAGMRMMALLEDILNFSNLDAQQMSGDAGKPDLAHLIEDVVAGIKPSTSAEFRNQTNERGKLLVVDDNEINRDILSRYLMRQGHEVVTAGSGTEALALLTENGFDLVLLDILMPEMNGYEVLEALKANSNLRSIPVIFISALDDTHGKVKAFQAGGADYITKPFQAEEVVARVENQLKLSRLQRELAQQNQELRRKNDELVRAQKRTDLVFSALAEVLPGTILDDKYQLDEKIGEGGFGAVYRGTHLQLNRPIAIKVFRPIAGNDNPEALERFRLEGVSASRVNHPNAVAVLDSGITPTGIAYLVMELLEGRSLTNELALKRVFSVKRAVEIAIPVCEALAEAHKVGIIHRDIKPDNIFLHRLKETEVVKVVDFGLAKMLSATADETLRAMTMAGSLMGTPGFMAPERITDQPYDGRVDIYSLGVVLYQMLTGRLPFVSEEGQAYAVLMMQLTEEPPAVRELNPLVPPALASIITMTLQKEPAGRPTAGELLAMLQKVYPLTDSATEVPANITTKDYRQKQTRIRPRTDTTAEAVVKTSLLPPKREPT